MTAERVDILGLQVSNISFDQALGQVKELVRNRVPSYVCFANSHMVIEAKKDKSFANDVNGATLVLADGMPVARAFYLLQNKKQERIAGMDFMPRLLAALNEDRNTQYRISFYGSTSDVLNALEKTVTVKFKNIIVAGKESPPFKTMEKWEQDIYITAINNTRPDIVFVGLGCPKQEKWMAENSKKINAVLLGVGGAFVTTAGLQKRAPEWMQKTSLEWLYRLAQEPGRLFKRYLTTNSSFVYLMIKALLKKLFYGKV